MKDLTLEKYTNLQKAVAKAFGVKDVEKRFAISAPIETQLNDKIQQSSGFLQLITMLPVTDLSGQAVSLAVEGLLAKRTNTAGGTSRTPTAFGGVGGTEWVAKKTEFDTSIRYDTLDAWARFKDFYQRYLNAVYGQIALDRITVGFYGQSAAAVTNPVTNPLGQDVNIGWLKLLETYNSANFMTQSGGTANEITIGEHGDYANADALAYDLLQGIPVEHRTGNEVVIIGAGLVTDSVSKGLAKHAGTPTEKAVGVSVLEGSFGGLKAMQVPKFPDNGMMVTDPKNLHLYYQEGRSRRNMVDKSELDCVIDYISSNDAYAIGNVKAIAAIKAENVILNPAAPVVGG